MPVGEAYRKQVALLIYLLSVAEEGHMDSKVDPSPLSLTVPQCSQACSSVTSEVT